MPRLLARLAVLATALVLLPATSLLTASSAAADPWVPGPSAYCATASITGAEPIYSHVVVYGAAALCPATPTAPGTQFALAIYVPGAELGLATSTEFRMFAPVGSSRPFGIGVPRVEGRYGLCVVRATNARLACVELTYTDRHGARITPISTEDQLVRRPVDVRFQTVTWPNCGGCF